MRVVKTKGSASSQRSKRMHGSTSEWRLQQLNGNENRDYDRPGGMFGGGNRNARRGSRRPSR